MPCMHKSKEEPVDKRSTRKGLFKPKKPRASKLTKVKSSGKIGLSLMLLGAVTNSADIVKELVIQKIDAGLDQMQYANTARKKGHVEKVCKNRSKPRQNQFQQQKVEARVAEESSDQEEHESSTSIKDYFGKTIKCHVGSRTKKSHETRWYR